MLDLLDDAARRALLYLQGCNERRVAPAPEALDRLKAWDTALPEAPQAPAETLRQLDDIGSPATMATAGGRFFGFFTGGRNRVLRVPVDSQGRMRPPRLPALNGPAIVCLQAGNVNTGAVDPFVELIGEAQARGAWVHVDGAFGLWARASTALAGLTAGIEQADGGCWCDPTLWQGQTAMRISICSWATRDEDISPCVATIRHIAAGRQG